MKKEREKEKEGELTLHSAPEAPVILSEIFLRSIPRFKFILLEWILRISALAFGERMINC